MRVAIAHARVGEMYQDKAGVGEEGAGEVLSVIDLPHVILPESGNLARQTAGLEGGMHHVRLHTKPAWHCSSLQPVLKRYGKQAE